MYEGPFACGLYYWRNFTLLPSYFTLLLYYIADWIIKLHYHYNTQLVYFVINSYFFAHFGMLYQDKSGNYESLDICVHMYHWNFYNVLHYLETQIIDYPIY
jgi:hypothetical protein